jgi:prevent-host-death family protein
MESIEITELAAHLAEYIARANAGERIAVTKDGKAVAYLAPANEPHSVFDQLVAAGHVKVSGRRVGDLLDFLDREPPPAREPGERPLSEVVLGMREEARW